MRILALMGMILLFISIVGLLLITILNKTGVVSLPKVNSNIFLGMWGMMVMFSSAAAYRAALEASQSKAANDMDGVFQQVIKGGQAVIGDKGISNSTSGGTSKTSDGTGTKTGSDPGSGHNS